MNQNYSQFNAMTFNVQNPYYVQFLKYMEKNKLKNQKKEEKKKLKEKNASFEDLETENTTSNINDSTKSDSMSFEEKYNTIGCEEYEYLCFITKKFFRDKLLICIIKFFLGVLSIVTACFLENFRPMNQKAKGPIMVFLFMYGLFIIPLSFLYTIVTFHCFCHYKNYVSTRTSIVAKQIIHFYDPETDRMQEVNWKNSVSNIVSSKREHKRIRGW